MGEVVLEVLSVGCVVGFFEVADVVGVAVEVVVDLVLLVGGEVVVDVLCFGGVAFGVGVPDGFEGWWCWGGYIIIYIIYIIVYGFRTGLV